MASLEVLVPLLVAISIISTTAVGARKATIDLSRYKAGDDMLSLYEIKTGNDPCTPLDIYKQLPLRTAYTEVDRVLKCTAAINAFESLGAVLHGPCQDFTRKSGPSVFLDECIYGKGNTGGFCGVQILVIKPRWHSIRAPKKKLEWVALTKCIRHLEFTNFAEGIQTPKPKPPFIVDALDYPVEPTKEQMQRLFEVKNNQDPCKPLHSQKNAEQGYTHLETTIYSKCRAAVKAFQSLPAELHGMCKHFRVSSELTRECDYGKGYSVGNCRIRMLVRFASIWGYAEVDRPTWRIHLVPLADCVEHLTFRNFFQSHIAIDLPPKTIKVSAYTNDLAKTDILLLYDIKQGLDPCASLDSDRNKILFPTKAEKEAINKCNGAVRAFKNLGTDLHGLCQNFGSNSDRLANHGRECIYGHVFSGGYCAVQILTRKFSFFTGGFIQDTLEWIPLKRCIEHLKIEL